MQKLTSLHGKDNISDDYRKQVEDFIENQSDLGSYIPLQQDELDASWEEISEALDIEEIWSNISSDLDIEMPANSGSGLLVKAIAAILIILISVISVKKPMPDYGSVKPDIMMGNKQNQQSAKPIIIDKPGAFNRGGKVNKQKCAIRTNQLI